MHVVTLGPAGTYSHRAAQSIADEGAVSFRESVTEIVAAVADGEFERGVVPVENSIEGSVDESLDALADREVSVVQEIVSPIRHALLAQGPEFDTVASHPQALAQCREYLTENYPDVAQEAVASTARGVERARENPSVAAIGHPANAGSPETGADGDDGDHPLQRIAENIQDRDSNATRFLVVAPESERSEAGGKTSLVVYPGANYPGLLLELLAAFADRDINLSRIESRPSGRRLGDYCFHFDIEAGLYETRTQEALAEVEAICADGWVRRLGSYDTHHVVE
ncbi:MULTISPECIES: prephenate dehydratase [Halolamina]|uniref:prephenate dehydratase n=1 Tax=Halolamina pelagica TaxID=699431 RepID=A0A1I5SFC2_9EURY|nr:MULTISPECIES: prephenate dehydratase [Halolamina]NHX37085.1 prephenate dehydratase [Halolamina sp. R1-12]SFP69433.1 prephenate dehydratase [Halolamina pelagica]